MSAGYPSPLPNVEEDPGHRRISVIITNYNYGRYLGNAIASVLAQTHPGVECIVVDDGSSDNSLEVARSFPGVIVLSKANGGQVSAAQVGIAHASGALTLFLDSDDALYPDICATLANAYDPEVTLYQGELDIVDEQGERIGGYPDAPFVNGNHVRTVLRNGFFPSSPTSGNAFRTDHVRRMLAEAGEELRYFVDGYLIYSAPFFGRIKVMDATFGAYLVHGANVSFSAGVNRRSAEKSLRNAVWQRTGIVNALRMTGQPAGAAVDYLTAWHLRYLLILRRSYGIGGLVDDLSDSAAAARAIEKFLRYPRITFKQRAQNIVLITLLLLGGTALGRRVVPPEV